MTNLPEDIRERVEKILDEPQVKDIPEDLWKTIYPTWTGLWTDYHGEFEERQPSDIYAVSDLLSSERYDKLIAQLLALLQEVDRKAREDILKTKIKEWKYDLKQSKHMTIDFAFSAENQIIYDAEVSASQRQWGYCIKSLEKQLSELQPPSKESKSE